MQGVQQGVPVSTAAASHLTPQTWQHACHFGAQQHTGFWKPTRGKSPSHTLTVCDACAVQAGSPCCPSNKDSPHTSTEDKLSREPFCTDGSVCFYFAPVPGFNNGDTYAANKGVLTGQLLHSDLSGMGRGGLRRAASTLFFLCCCVSACTLHANSPEAAAQIGYLQGHRRCLCDAGAQTSAVSAPALSVCAGAYACTAVEDDCGTGPGKPCCPFAHKVTTNPPLKRTGCADDMFCNYDFSATAAAEALSSEYRTASVPGTCERNAADCGQFDKGCCITTSPLSTSMTCGARWNETGQRGYCADPFDSNNSAGPGLTGGPPQVAVAGRRFLLDSGGSDVSSKGGSASDGGRNGGDNGSSSGGGNGDGSGKGGDGSDSNSTKQRARLNQLVCTRCPPRNDNVANNPSKYWPC